MSREGIHLTFFLPAARAMDMPCERPLLPAVQAFTLTVKLINNNKTTVGTELIVTPKGQYCYAFFYFFFYSLLDVSSLLLPYSSSYHNALHVDIQHLYCNPTKMDMTSQFFHVEFYPSHQIQQKRSASGSPPPTFGGVTLFISSVSSYFYPGAQPDTKVCDL